MLTALEGNGKRWAMASTFDANSLAHTLDSAVDFYTKERATVTVNPEVLDCEAATTVSLSPLEVLDRMTTMLGGMTASAELVASLADDYALPQLVTLAQDFANMQAVLLLQVARLQAKEFAASEDQS